MTINKPSIILVRPQLPENIGLVARAMDNCGLKKLIIVKPREKWPNKYAIKSSANSSSIIKKTKVYENLKDALLSFNYVLATSSRKRFLRKPVYNNFNKCLKNIPFDKKVAIIFGPENSGLSNSDLNLCDSILNISLSNSNTSLNLSHAVLLFSYKFSEIISNKNFVHITDNIDKNLASKKDFNYFMVFLENELHRSKFLFPKNKSENMFINIQSMFLRAKLSKKEIQTLWGMIKNLRNNKK